MRSKHIMLVDYDKHDLGVSMLEKKKITKNFKRDIIIFSSLYTFMETYRKKQLQRTFFGVASKQID